MATKPRYLKTPTQLWVYDNAKRLNLTEDDLAKAADVRPGTARSWFSRGKPNADAIPALERLFGRPAPIEEQPVGDPTALVQALQAQTTAISALVDEMRARRLLDQAEGSALFQFAESVAKLAQQRERVEA